MDKILEKLRPDLSTPFPNESGIWTCPVTGLKVPKDPMANLQYREKIIRKAANDKKMQDELMKACSLSLPYWMNTFVWTYHQFEVHDGMRTLSEFPHTPFIVWECQEHILDEFIKALGVVRDAKKTGKTLTEAIDVLINKSRDMGASWLCICFIHWLWLFWPEAQLLELSRTEDYVDKAGNMKTLFQKHDYINKWLPEWMLPPDCLYGQKNRTRMHMKNILNGSCIDGEATTEHAASGDRRIVILLDEFAKVRNGALMRSATRDAGLIRIINSTTMAGTEYAKWKNSEQIKVIPLMWWDHPQKGEGRYTVQDPITGSWKIRSPWYDAECKVRSPQEVARELDAEDVESGSQFFTIENINKHIAQYACEPIAEWDVRFKRDIAEDHIKGIIRSRDLKKIDAKRVRKGSLRVWTELIKGRPDQTMDYVFGIDISKGQGASNSVVSILCKQTKEKIAEWRNANVPPYEMAPIVMALAIWCGGRRKLPFLKWEMNGPGWDFGRKAVKDYHYPFYYRNVKAGSVRDKKTKSYGWHNSRGNKLELLTNYDRALAHGAIINHSIFGLNEAKRYIHYDSGGIGPVDLMEESASAKQTHGDIVIADALTIDDSIAYVKYDDPDIPKTNRCAAYRRKIALKKKRQKVGFGSSFDFRK